MKLCSTHSGKIHLYSYSAILMFGLLNPRLRTQFLQIVEITERSDAWSFPRFLFVDADRFFVVLVLIQAFVTLTAAANEIIVSSFSTPVPSLLVAGFIPGRNCSKSSPVRS
jgi:hypothetical protein